MAYCPRCGAQTPQDARFCANCGQAFGEASQQPPAPQYAQHAPPPPGAGFQQTAVAAWPGQRLGLPQYGPNALADPGQRLVARIIDWLIVGVVFVVLIVLLLVPLSVTTDTTTGVGEGPAASFAVLALIIPFGVVLLYEVAMIATLGQTLGKMAMGIKVVLSATGAIPGWGPSFVRWIVQAAMGFIPLLPLLDNLWLLWDENRQCLHDKAANTLVVRVR